ncbi:hypothetical protein DFQ10_10633 [Winogradskyella eximia]|uniref:Uncharacterized protein n=1 Tax=Winogradskyella eximia TaxID=262006 RepID=A0A3D9H0U1_9FLAO|nr:hypothetical protein DFQ10_10633 [Winogradskyella eximia]
MKQFTKKVIDIFFWLLKWTIISIITIAIIYLGWMSYGGIEL